MEEQNFETVKHPLFGEILTTQAENGQTLYKASRVAESIGMKNHKVYVGKKIKAYIIKVEKVNALGYIVKMPVKFVDETGIRKMMLYVLEQEQRQAFVNYKKRISSLNPKA